MYSALESLRSALRNYYRSRFPTEESVEDREVVRVEEARSDDAYELHVIYSVRPGPERGVEERTEPAAFPFGEDTLRELKRLERKVDQLETEASFYARMAGLQDRLKDEFDRFELERWVEAELTKLKRQYEKEVQRDKQH